MFKVSISLNDVRGGELCRAVGEQLALGDVKPEEGESQFSAALAQAFAKTPPSSPPPPTSPTSPVAPIDTKKK